MSQILISVPEPESTHPDRLRSGSWLVATTPGGSDSYSDSEPLIWTSVSWMIYFVMVLNSHNLQNFCFRDLIIHLAYRQGNNVEAHSQRTYSTQTVKESFSQSPTTDPRPSTYRTNRTQINSIFQIIGRKILGGPCFPARANTFHLEIYEHFHGNADLVGMLFVSECCILTKMGRTIDLLGLS